MNLYQTQIPRPQDWQQLQRIALAYYKASFPRCVVGEYGTHGQAQDGVDVYVNGHEESIGVQCKCVEDFTPSELEKEFNKTKAFKNPLKKYIVLVTVKRDTKLQDKATELSKDGRGILVEVMFWQPFAELVIDFDDLAKKFFNFVVKVPIEVVAKGASALVTLNTQDTHYKFVVTKMADLNPAQSTTLLLITSLQADKKAAYFTLGATHWSDFHKVIGAGKFDAATVALWFSKFSTFEDISNTSGQVQTMLLSDADIKALKISIT